MTIKPYSKEALYQAFFWGAVSFVVVNSLPESWFRSRRISTDFLDIGKDGWILTGKSAKYN